MLQRLLNHLKTPVVEGEQQIADIVSEPAQQEQQTEVQTESSIINPALTNIDKYLTRSEKEKELEKEIEGPDKRFQPLIWE